MSSDSSYDRGRLLGATCAVVLYFSVLLIPKIFPAFSGTIFFGVYLLSIPAVFLVLLGVVLWGSITVLRARMRGTPLKTGYRSLLLVACVGILSCIIAFSLARVLPRPLPSGSNLLPFDSNKWKEPRSSEYVANDITLRQKMLTDVVKNILPSRTREQIEQALGPSLETTYFSSNGRDLIYHLGPERDVFLGLDSEWLLIWLDGSGHFKRYVIAND